jgi:hypothetical protein
MLDPMRIVNDISFRDRVGLAGATAGTALRNLSLAVPARRFECIEQEDGSLLLKLDAGEFLWLGNVALQEPLSSRAYELAENNECYRLHWRSSHAWIAVSGAEAPSLLSEMCACDLHPSRLVNLTCIPTMLARIPILLLRWDCKGKLCLHLLVPRPHAAAVLDYLEKRQSAIACTADP